MLYTVYRDINHSSQHPAGTSVILTSIQAPPAPTPAAPPPLTINQVRISGLIQTRIETVFGQNVPFHDTAISGIGLRPGWGGANVGGAQSGFMVRNGNVRFDVPAAVNQTVTFQLDFPSYGPATIRDAFVAWRLPGDRTTITAGQFIPQFGYELRSSGRVRETDERAMAFSDSSMSSITFRTNTTGIGGVVNPGSVLPFFTGQDRDQGIQLQHLVRPQANDQALATVSVINGEGRDAAGMYNQNGLFDMVGRFERSHVFGKRTDTIGMSGYYGHLAARTAARTDGIPMPFANAARRVAGIDLRRSWTSGREVRFEYMMGEFEVSPDRALYIPRNRVSGYYGVYRYPLDHRSSVFCKYDVYNPGNPPGTTFDDSRKLLTAGFLQRLQPNTLLRVIWLQGLTPFDPSATNGYRARVGSLNVEPQVEF